MIDLKNIKKNSLITIGVITLASIVGIISYTKGLMIVNKNMNKIVEHVNKGKDTTKDEHISHIFNTMHQIANSKIVAEDGLVWGEIQPTQAVVDGLIKDVNSTDYGDKNYLLEILNRWKNGDFSKCVEEHNYLWNKLGGEVGKAKSLR